MSTFFSKKKAQLRIYSILHPVRTLKTLYFIQYIKHTDKWKRIVETNPKKAVDMRWNRLYRKPFPWKNPQTLNEKVIWLSVMTDTSKWTEYTDKYEVRKYIKSLGLEDILTECYGVWDSAEEIDFDKLPEKFVLKCTHDCGSTIIVRDKKAIDKRKVIDFLQERLAVRYGYDSCEPHYVAIKPRVMAESLIENDNAEFFSQTAVDHKIRCIDGKAQYDFVCYDRELESGSGGSKTIFDLYDIQSWKPMHQYLADKDAEYRLVPRPENLERMVDIAEKISQGFPTLRVDLYDVKGKIYFGEMTFTAFAGMNNHFTEEFQEMIGGKISLPKV